MSISNSYPTQTPSLNLNFATGSDQFLDSRISFSRADTPPTYAAPSAVHYWSKEKHLSAENLIDNSNSYDSGGWSETRVDQTIGQTDPTGGTSAKLIDQTSGQTTAGVVYYTSTIGANELTFSIFLKPNGRTKPNLAENLTDSGNTVKRTYFDLTGAGAVGTKDAAHTASIAKFGDWYRCTITFTPHAADSGSVYLYISDTDNSQTVADDGNGYTVFGANLSTTGQLVTSETSGSIHREYSSTLKSVTNSGDPRFEFDPITGNSEGLLIEQQSTNLTVSSQQVENWTPQEATVQPNVAIAPDGTLGADKLTESTTAASTHWIYQSTALGVSVGSTVYSVSFYAKAAGRTEFQTYDNAQNTSGNLHVNLANGTITSGTGVIKSCGDGWYRISYQVTADAGTTSVVRILMKDAGSITYDGDGFSGILLWGMQVEIGSAPTSYIKTTTSATATRAADSCSVADFGYTGGDATVYVESTSSGGDFPGLIGLDDGGSTNCMRVFRNSGSATNTTDFQYNINDSSGSNQVASIVSGSGAGTKFAMRLANNNAAFAFDGNTPATDTTCVMPVATTLDIGSGAGVSQINGTIKRVALYNVALSDTELQSLTS